MVVLDVDQLRAVEAFEQGTSVAILGGAGSGKSFVVSEILARASAQIGQFPKVTACAFTNQAASSLGGLTLHKLLGAPACWEFSKKHLFELVKKRPAIACVLRQIEVLIIDEISMIKRNELDALDYVLRMLSLDDCD